MPIFQNFTAYGEGAPSFGLSLSTNSVIGSGPQIGFREATVDRSIYEYCDLTDAEILEREERLAAERAKELAKERKRMAKASNFHFRGGML
jgi:hypothetical protein